MLKGIFLNSLKEKIQAENYIRLGMIKEKEVLILVDCGASTNFISKELGGTDLVLGMDWLASLGNVKAHFKNLILTLEIKVRRKASKLILHYGNLKHHGRQW